MRAAPLSALIAALLAAQPALAQTLTIEEFEAYATGRTLTYGIGGQVYGVEQYLPGRRVLWAFRGDECRKGYYYEADGEICFVYEHDPTPQCWTFEKRPTGLSARFTGDPPGSELSEVAQTPDPLICAGPEVGV